MRTKDNVTEEYEARLEALEKKFSFDRANLEKRHERERKIIEERYARILKSFDNRKLQ